MSKYTEAVERRLKGLNAASTGVCPGCEDCASNHDMTLADFNAAYDACKISHHEASFSWSACEVCGSTLGGDRYAWHAITSDGELLHRDNACTDCVLYLGNGDVPEEN